MNRTRLFTFYILSCIFVCCTHTTLYAKTPDSTIKIVTATRYDLQFLRDNIEYQKKRIQYQVSAYYDVVLLRNQSIGHFHLKGLMGTGESYTSQWNTLYNFIDHQVENQFLNMRQIFLAWIYHDWRWEIGVIPPVKGKVSNTSLDKDGWIRGTRIVAPLPKGELELVTGAVDHLEASNAFQLWESWNYHELEWTQGWFENWRSEAGYVSLNSQNYVRAEARWIYQTISKMTVELANEVLHNISTSSWAFDVSASLKISDWKLIGEYSHVPETFGLLGELSNDFFTLGHLGMLSIKAPIIKDKGLN